MKVLRKTTIATLAGLGALAVAASAPALSHGTGGQGGPGYGPGFGMMGGMMGHGAGYGGQQGFGPGYGGMMGPGYSGMMGHGYGMAGQVYGNAPCGQAAAQTDQDLDIGDVQTRLERWLAMQGNDRLKLGKIEAVDDDTITAEIVTVDESLVRKLAVDRHSGQMQPAK